MTNVVDLLQDFAASLKLQTDQIIETRQTVFALVGALTNQPALDRERLSQDFLTQLRLVEARLDPPSKEVQALLTLLRAPTERTPQLSVAQRLMRSGALQSHEDRPGDPPDQPR